MERDISKKETYLVYDFHHTHAFYWSKPGTTLIINWTNASKPLNFTKNPNLSQAVRLKDTTTSPPSSSPPNLNRPLQPTQDPQIDATASSLPRRMLKHDIASPVFVFPRRSGILLAAPIDTLRGAALAR